MPAKKRKNTDDPTTPQSAATKKYGAGWGVVETDLTCPSGAEVRVRRPGVPGLVSAGVIDNVDLVTNIVQEKHIKRARGVKPAMNAKSLLADKEGLLQAMAVIGKIVSYCILLPEVRCAYVFATVDGKEVARLIPPEDREQGVIYSDTIPEEDQMFVMQFAVGGTRDLERFREQLSENVGSVADGEDLSL